MGVVLPFFAANQVSAQSGFGAPRFGPRPHVRAAAREAPLRCLDGGELAGRFHKWRARSGRGYVFSVFATRPRDAPGAGPIGACAEPASPLAGLPEFESAVAFGVVRTAEGGLRRLAPFEILWRDGRFCGDAGGAWAALRAGAVEWHVHLLARDAAARRIVLDDFSA